MTELPGPGLSAEQWQQIKALVQALSPSQTFWVSGHFTGVDKAAQWIAAQMALAVAPASASAPRRPLTILVGCEAGASAGIVAALARAAAAAGLAAEVIDMADYALPRLRDEQDILVVTSTSDADPPTPAAPFFAFAAARRAPRLPGVRYAVFALGAAGDERYREAGPWLDRRLEELGATRLLPCVDCDLGEVAASGAASRREPGPRRCTPWSPPRRCRTGNGHRRT
ncbi:flavodoxin domain-containing protein [Vineibacter terrae]|nr:flavodoxin domain-containing protein [Vineibacter terrae]